MTIPADGLPLKSNAGLDLLEGVVVLDLTGSVAGPLCRAIAGRSGRHRD